MTFYFPFTGNFLITLLKCYKELDTHFAAVQSGKVSPSLTFPSQKAGKGRYFYREKGKIVNKIKGGIVKKSFVVL
ncbi:MAG: hypothetical protein LBO64_07740, partial [Desulfovibrio sp.]|nr:hypothetical protein [Desulfovibrio sp.]